ncbi:hypothetical protein A1O3_04950 [Capronia epimyces CBS 606.96]|uniref:DUF7580 domain-containing protein n=1 Tax=Capronia epimyces CBS 606.96 TaxID=1182542 RepID=W9XVM1_9EURO|nr:uncharacterized protein A1O3_04950 [Capronia epimyces CBS 606.96]EXJ84283.1 hypothetical protein A1O3_04950 [Capronia epimyces CBS 606.96]
MSGFEIAGTVLAALPLVINLISEYREGLDAVRTLTSHRRYRRELERYENGLSTQNTIFRNVLEQVLLRIVHNDEDMAELLQNPDSELWQRSPYDGALQNMLGSSHGAFMATMRELVHLLQSLKKKLGGEPPSARMRELKRLKDVLSRDFYDTLLDKIQGANRTLLTLVEQVDSIADIRKNRRPVRKLIQEYSRVRHHARSVHDTFVRGSCWKCPCKSQHIVQLRLEPRPSRSNASEPRSPGSSSRFTVNLVLCGPNDTTGAFVAGGEIEIQSADVEANPEPAAVAQNLKQLEISQVTQVSGQKKEVRFSIVKSTLDAIQPTQEISSQRQIHDLCNAFSQCPPEISKREHMGFIIDNLNGRRHDIYRIRKLPGNQSIRSVASILTDPSMLLRVGHFQLPAINRRNRRYLAATLASSVLQLHGSWLQSNWGLNDILVLEQPDYCSNEISFPYISRALVEAAMENCRRAGGTMITSALIRSGILFPLGLTLVELSLGQSLQALHLPEDDDPVDAVANLKTASRLLELVLNESGSRYCDVVKTCLFWTGPDGNELDDERLQCAVFEKVVMPLLDDYDDFEGNSFIH